MTISLTEVLPITAPEQYKLHLACWNGEVHPLDVFVADHADWQGWNEWRGNKNDWTRPRILSFIHFYPKTDAWLFGGAFDVIARRDDRYDLRSDARLEKYIGRLIASFRRVQGMRGRAFYLESYLPQFTVIEILPRIYSGESFPGFENVEHDFGTLEAIFRAERADWKAALENTKGIYLIVDKSNGRKYVGSAYGEAGIWSRWAAYIGTGHGWNDELVKLIKVKGPNYARENFKFSVLEVMVRSAPDDVVLLREAHWKRVLLTRDFGYNRN
jgi:hypothetical protein